MLNNRLIGSPSVIQISQPAFVVGGVHQFAVEQGLEDFADDEATPLGRIAAQSADFSKADDIHNDGEVLVEYGGRQCYAAWEKGRSSESYIENIISMGHGSVLAHAHYSFQITGVSRSLTHELVRHAAGVDISQESQRYVDAKTTRFVVPPALLHAWDGDLECPKAMRFLDRNTAAVEAYIEVQDEIEALIEDYDRFPLEPFYSQVIPIVTGTDKHFGLLTEAEAAEVIRKAEIKRKTVLRKRANETARCHLPNACETKLLWTANLRSLRHIIPLRGANDADLEIRRFAAHLGREAAKMAPGTFKDMTIANDDFGVDSVTMLYRKP